MREEDDIIAPKTNTRGEVYETYLTHRIADHFIFKADFIRYNYTWSGSGWHIGAPKRLEARPEDLEALRASVRTEVRDAIHRHLRHEPTLQSKSRIKRRMGNPLRTCSLKPNRPCRQMCRS